MLKNVIVYVEICNIYANICKFLHMQHNFRICGFENAIIYGKIRDMRVLAKYAIGYAIAYSHITDILNIVLDRAIDVQIPDT